jgi:hypothetical protein
LAASGVLRPENTAAEQMSQPLTRGEVAEMLDGALDVVAQRESGGWLPW